MILDELNKLLSRKKEKINKNNNNNEIQTDSHDDNTHEFGGKIICYSKEDDALTVDGRIVYRSDVYNLKGKHKLKFTFVSSNGVDEQLILLVMDKKFDGEISWNGQKYKVPKCAFPTLDLYEKYMGKEFILDIDLKNDDLHICNGVVEDGCVDYWDFENMGGMYIEEVTSNKKRYICNAPNSKDYEFDDLVFEIEILD